MASRWHPQSRWSNAGFALSEVVAVGVILALLVVGVLVFINRGSGSGSTATTNLQRNDYWMEWQTPPPTELNGELWIQYKVQVKTSDLRDGFVIRESAWEDSAGANVTFTLAGGVAARLSDGSTNNLLQVSATTGSDGIAKALLYPQGVGPGSLSVHVSIPAGPAGTDPDTKQFVAH